MKCDICAWQGVEEEAVAICIVKKRASLPQLGTKFAFPNVADTELSRAFWYEQFTTAF